MQISSQRAVGKHHRTAKSVPALAARSSVAPGLTGRDVRQVQARRTVCAASPLDQIREMLTGSKVLKEEEDLGEMAPLDQHTPAGTEGVFGPTAVLLVGFLKDEVDHFRAVLDDMGADMVQVVAAGRSTMDQTLQQALEKGPVEYEQPPLGQRRAVVLSGMFTTEVVEIISGYKDAGLPPTVFAAAVPNNWQRKVSDVVESCWKDQMVAMQRAAIGKMEASIEDA